MSNKSNNDWDDTAVALPGALDDLLPSQAYLVVVRGSNVGETFAITGPAMVIGRGAGADLRLNDEGVSRFHCKIRHEQGVFLVEDLGSRNGTFCNGEPVLPTMRTLVEGDRLQIGTSFVLRFTFVESSVRSSAPMVQDAVRDPLTGTYSKHYFMDRLDKDFTAALERKSPLSLMLVHVDRFSEIEAPDVLDQTLVAVATQLREGIHADDVLARIGTGDFAVLSMWSSPGNTFMLAERMRKNANAVIAAEPPITLSLGIAAISELSIESPHDLLVAAGSALQRARSQGGNRTVLCTPDLIREPRNRATV